MGSSAAKIGAKLVLEGEKEYRQALKDIAAAQKELRSEMKLSAEQHKNDADSIEALKEKYEILSKQVEKQTEKTKVYSDAIEDMQERQKKQKKHAEELAAALEKEEEKLQTLTQLYGENADEVQKQSKVVAEMKTKVELAEDAYDRAGRKISEWKTSLNNSRTELIKMSDNLQETKQKLDETEHGTDDLQKSIETLGKEADEASKKTSEFGDVLKANLVSEVVLEGAKKIAQGIGEITKAAITMGRDFEQSMSQVAATMGITAEQIKNGSKDYKILEDAAKECGKTTKFSASEAAEALNYLALAGYDARKAAETLPKVLNLAAAGGMDLAYASDLVTDSMAALGMETAELDAYIDQMAKTSQKSNTNIAQLGEASLVCAGMVSLADQSIETMNTELGILANNGIKGAEGGTHLRNVIQALVAPTDKAAEEMESLGLKVEDSQGKIRDMNDIMTDLNGILSTMTDAEKTKTIAKIFNATDISAVNALLKGTGDEFQTLKKHIEESEGAASDMAATMSDNLAGKVDNLESALEGLGITAYEKIEGTMKDSVDAATESVDRLQDSMENGRLGEAMDDFSESLGEAAESAIDFAEDALPVVIEGLTWILDNGELVASGIAGIVTANFTMQKVVPIVNAAADAWATYKKTSDIASAAQKVLNGTMMANPAGLIITSVAALASMLATYVLTTKEATSETQIFLDKSKENLENLNKEIGERKESTQANMTEIEVLKSLGQEIETLNRKESLSTEEKTKLKMAVDQLNEAIPELNLNIDEQTGKLEENTEGWEMNFDAQLEAMEAAAKQEELTEILNEAMEAEKQLAEVQAKRADMEAELAEATGEYNSFLEKNKDALEDCAIMYANGITPAYEYQLKIGELARTVEETTGQEQELKETLQELRGEYGDLQEEINDTNETMSGAESYTMEYKGQIYELVGASQQTIDKIEELKGSYNEALGEAMESVSGQVSLFEELKTASDLTVGQMAENLKTQTETFSQYSEDLQAAARLTKDGANPEFESILQAIMDMGIDGAGYLHELVTAAEESSGEFQEVLSEWGNMVEAREDFTQTLADMQTGYSEKMDELLGIQSEKNETRVNEEELTNKELLRINQENNDNIVKDEKQSYEELTKQLDAQKPILIEKVKLMTQDVIKAAETELEMVEGKSNRFSRIGKSIPESIAEGITMGTSAMAEAVKSMVEAAVESVDISALASKIDREIGKAMG